MGPKSITVIVLVVIALGAVVAGMNGYFGQNDDQDWQVLQSPFGTMSVRTDSGIYQKQFANAWTYPKVQRVYFSSDVREGSSLDESCKVVFSDKGTASFSTMVLYRSPYMLSGLAIPDINDEGDQPKGLKEGAVANFHRLCKGDIKIADATVLARLKEYARIVASDYNASQSVDSQDAFIASIRKSLKEDKTLVSYGIDVEEVTLSDISFDAKTIAQFEKQQEAILASKEAEARKIQYDMQKLETDAQYAQKIAEQKGIAEMEKMKQTTDAARDAELATIEAQKNVDVATLAKVQAETEAAMKESVAKIEKEAALIVASKSFEVAQIAANEAEEEKKAMISLAEGKQKSIELSGAITEQEEVLAKIAAQRDVSISANYAKIAVPSTIFMGGGSSDGKGSADYFGNLMSYALAQNTGLLPKESPKFVPIKVLPSK